jgi:hypothetical protein
MCGSEATATAMVERRPSLGRSVVFGASRPDVLIWLDVDSEQVVKWGRTPEAVQLIGLEVERLGALREWGGAVGAPVARMHGSQSVTGFVRGPNVGRLLWGRAPEDRKATVWRTAIGLAADLDRGALGSSNSDLTVTNLIDGDGRLQLIDWKDDVATDPAHAPALTSLLVSAIAYRRSDVRLDRLSQLMRWAGEDVGLLVGGSVEATILDDALPLRAVPEVARREIATALRAQR